MPVDGNIDRAMSQAETVTALPLIHDKLKVLIINILDEDASIRESSDMLKPERVDSINRTKEFFDENGIPVETRRISGDPAEKIVEVADEADVDAICISGRKRSPAGKAIFGSTSQRVILTTDRPVIITTQTT